MSDGLIEERDAEIARLRREVRHAHAALAGTLARATRLSQLVSSVVQLTDPQAILERAATEVAEQFGADIAAFLMRTGRSEAPRLALAAHWGIPERNLPDAIDDPPARVETLDPMRPLGGSAEELGVPAWLRRSGPRHLVWARLTLRDDPLGFLLLARRVDEPFSPDDVRELGLIVNRIALAVDNGRLYSRTQEQLHRLRRLHEVAAGFVGTVDIQRVVDSLATTVLTEVPVAGVAIYLGDKRGLELAAETGSIADAPAEIPNEALPTWPDRRLIRMGGDGAPAGALLLSGRPPAGSEADSFLQHLVDLGSLTIGKAQLFERIRTQAESDPLTGLPNRTLLMTRLESALSLCRAEGTDLSLIFVDLDQFKAVNDTYGHDVGDQLLNAVAGRLTDLAESADTVARLGGDEFVLVHADTDTAEAYGAVQQIRSAMATPFELGEVIIANNASVGFAMASSCAYHAKRLMREADASMYVDKLRDRRPPEPDPPATTGSRPRERGIGLPSRRREIKESRPVAQPSSARSTATRHVAAQDVTARPVVARSVKAPAAPGTPVEGAGNLRSWCRAWLARSDRAVTAAAGETVRRILSTARDQLEMDLVWLSRFVNGRYILEAFSGDPARFRLSVGSDVALADTYCVRVLEGRLPANLPDTRADERTARLPITDDLGLGAYVGAPVFVRRGELFGMLCAVSREPEPSLRHRDAKLLRRLAGLLTEPLTASLARDVQSSAFVRNALTMLDMGGMSVDLQPIVDLGSGDIVSVEALARFASYPYSVEGWFAQAHEAGCGRELEMDAVEHAHRLLRRLPGPLTLAMNASPDVACSKALLDVVTSNDPTRVVVEITEHRRASEPTLSTAAVRRLRGEGVRVAIDDAGTGYSDLRQILELQPDIVKLDRALIDGVDTDPVKAALLQALVVFGRDTGTELVAEGVSTEAIRDALRDLGVEYGQGYALGRPEPAPALIARLRHR